MCPRRNSAAVKSAGRSSSSSARGVRHDGARRPWLPRAVGALAIVVAACGGESTAAGRATYVATLTGAREVPAAITAASGTATFERTGSDVTYRVSATGFTTALTVGHIHIGGSGVIGSVIVPFTIIAQGGIVAEGTIDLSRPVTQGNITITGDSLRTLLDNGGAYVNLHTAAWPGGEIRGQIVRQ